MDALTVVNGYTDRLTIKQRLGEVGTEQDLRIDSVITAVSRWIDNECERTFILQAVQVRYYTPTDPVVLLIDDYTAVSDVSTDLDGDGTYESVWAATDYYLEPRNGRLLIPPVPYTTVHRALYGTYWWPTWIPNGARITADFGFDTTIPTIISEACILQTVRLCRRSDAPFGIVGSSDMGQTVVIGKMDPDVRALLAPYKRWHVV